MAKKLKVLKSNLKSWNIEDFGNVVIRKNMALSLVDSWDSKERMGALSQEEVVAREEVRMEHHN